MPKLNRMPVLSIPVNMDTGKGFYQIGILKVSLRPGREDQASEKAESLCAKIARRAGLVQDPGPDFASLMRWEPMGNNRPLEAPRRHGMGFPRLFEALAEFLGPNYIYISDDPFHPETYRKRSEPLGADAWGNYQDSTPREDIIRSICIDEGDPDGSVSGLSAWRSSGGLNLEPWHSSGPSWAEGRKHEVLRLGSTATNPRDCFSDFWDTLLNFEIGWSNQKSDFETYWFGGNE